ncbi:WD40 repeat domain-containing protein [Streptomyces lavendofoliae]|uniref:WD40 repeat domain-containing protein n=1 Tax=Streptomyces lavendofoliae TaxID=67314 RepID=UPI003D8EF50D
MFVQGSGTDASGAICPEVLVNGGPERVRQVLEGSPLVAAVYEASGHVHRWATAGVRRQLLALDAVRYGQGRLAEHIGRTAVGQEGETAWAVQWATGSDLDARQRYALPVSAEVQVVAAVVVEGGGMAVAGCRDGTLHRWCLTTGRQLGKALTDHPSAVYALATAVLDGRPVAVTGCRDNLVRLWDLTEGKQLDEFAPHGDAVVFSLATGRVEGRPVTVSGSRDGLVRVWDLATGEQRGTPLSGHAGTVTAVATSVVHGRPVAVTGGVDGSVRVWDLIAGTQTGSLTYHHGEVSAVSADPACDPPLAVSFGDREVCVWNLATGELVGEPIHDPYITAMAMGMLGGRPAALVGYGPLGPVQVWDLSTRRHLRLPLTGHKAVRGAATAAVRGCHLAVTGAGDRSVRIWDLDGEREAGSPVRAHLGKVSRVATAVVDGHPVVVSGGWDGTVRIWDLDGGGQLGEPLTGHTGAVALLTVETVDGRPTLITRDMHETVRVWDLTTREQLHGRTTPAYSSVGIAFFAAVEGRLVAVTWQGRVWDFTSGEWIGVQPQRAKALALKPFEGHDVILTSLETEAVQLWDMATGEPLGSPMTCHTSPVRAGAMGTLDGRLVVTAGGEDGTVSVWDAIRGRQTGVYTFPSAIESVALAPDGRLVVAFGSDIAVLIAR